MSKLIKTRSLAKMAIVNSRNGYRARGAQKIFCVGRNKTGTTSLEQAFHDLGFVLGHQPTAEHLAHKYYFDKNFGRIITYCRFGQVFQDAPFSWPSTYKYLDSAFPGSKFILTVRDDSEQWYRSITRFHAKKFGTNGETPTADELKAACYRRKGFMYNVVRVHGTPDSDPYNHEILTAHYERHNQQVIEHFKQRPEQLLVLNVAEKDAYRRFVDFLGVSSARMSFPWKNRT